MLYDFILLKETYQTKNKGDAIDAKEEVIKVYGIGYRKGGD